MTRCPTSTTTLHTIGHLVPSWQGMLFVHLPWGAQFVVFPEDSQSLGPCRIEPAPTPIAYLEAAKSSTLGLQTQTLQDSVDSGVVVAAARGAIAVRSVTAVRMMRSDGEWQHDSGAGGNNALAGKNSQCSGGGILYAGVCCVISYLTCVPKGHIYGSGSATADQWRWSFRWFSSIPSPSSVICSNPRSTTPS